MSDSRAIGVFDSGLGGLTVLSALHRALPNESTVYLGDTARLPYGTKSAQTVVRYALNNAQTLLSMAPLKLLVVACNTVSAVALEALRSAFSIPVIGVIEPGARVALGYPKTKSIAVLATSGTTQSRAYETVLRSLGFSGEIRLQACPLFVPLVEEGLISGPVANTVVRHYMDLIPPHVDSIILGCTHYPLLLPLLKEVSHPVKWIDSGHAVASAVYQALQAQGLQSDVQDSPLRRYLVTDAPHRFEHLSEFYLGKPVLPRNVELIDIGVAI